MREHKLPLEAVLPDGKWKQDLLSASSTQSMCGWSRLCALKLFL